MKTKQKAKKDVKKAVSVTKKMMPLSGKTSNKKVYPENKRTRVVDVGYLGKSQGVPKKLPKKNSVGNTTK